MNGIVEFFSNHMVLAALIASTAWFYAGYQFISEGKLIVGLSWQGIGVLLLSIFGFGAIVSHDWLNLIVAIVAIAVELYLMRRAWLKHRLDPTPSPSA